MFWPGTYGIAETIYFPLITAAGTDFQTTWTPAASESQRSLDGAAFGNTSNTPAHEGNGIWSLVLTAAEMAARVTVVTLSDGATDIEDQAIIIHTGLGHQLQALEGIELYSINDTDVTPTSTVFQADRGFGRAEEATASHFNERRIVFLDGNLQSKMTAISAYSQVNSRGQFTVASLGEAPAEPDSFLIL